MVPLLTTTQVRPFSPVSLVAWAASGGPGWLVLSWGGARMVESSASSGSSEKGKGWLAASPRGRVCISFSFRNLLDIRLHQDCVGGKRRKELKGQKNRPRDKGPTPYSFPLPRSQAGTANPPQHPSLNITQLAKFFPSPFKEEGQPSGLPCHPAAWGCSRVAWPLSGAAGACGWAGLGPCSLACTQMPAVEQVQCLRAQKNSV